MDFIYLIITFIICAASITDILLTDKVMKMFLANKNELSPHLKLPIKTQEDLECNTVVKFLWKRIGVKKTKLIFLVFAPLIIFGMLVLAYYKFEYSQIVLGMFIGAYLIINRIHLENIFFIKNKLKEDKTAQ